MTYVCMWGAEARILCPLSQNVHRSSPTVCVYGGSSWQHFSVISRLLQQYHALFSHWTTIFFLYVTIWFTFARFRVYRNFCDAHDAVAIYLFLNSLYEYSASWQNYSVSSRLLQQYHILFSHQTAIFFLYDAIWFTIARLGVYRNFCEAHDVAAIYFFVNTIVSYYLYVW